MEEETKVALGSTALYLEMVKAANRLAYQVFLIPQGFSASGDNVPATVIFRALTADKNRSTWKFITGSLQPFDPASTTAQDARMLAENLLVDFVDKFTMLADNGYKLRERAIYLEVTPDDRNFVYTSSTPWDLIKRMERTRKSYGYPENVVDPERSMKKVVV